jgi:HAD superfamily phosphoserine phosphatase-like hydrolase
MNNKLPRAKAHGILSTSMDSCFIHGLKSVVFAEKFNKNQIKAIIFDIDGTLSSEVSWLKISKELGASVKRHSKIFEKYAKRKITYKKAKTDLIKLWQETGSANKVYMTNMFDSWKLKEDAHDVISHLKKNYRIVLISGSVDLYVNCVADKLGIDDWYANTKTDWDKKGNLINFHYFRNQALKKLVQFRHLKKKYSLKNGNCAVVGDGDNELLLFKRVKKSVLVLKEKPHPELDSYIYKKIKKLTELKKIF